ncbi:hypothetical protein ACFYY8_06270 [Streptosporangium sp. NPDC001559]|uniref:hypothetical protein n=1 Tax=Streptosporangium sp. NPDC001559 TaxID=3366187 RepID=UPI0036E7BEF3
MTYATVDDLVGYVSPTPANAALLLTRASRLVGQALLCAVYDPDDVAVQTALREATCEQVAAWATAGEDGSGVTPVYSTVTIGSVTLGGRSSGGGTNNGSASTSGLAPQAYAVLQAAGLTGHAPQTWSC